MSLLFQLIAGCVMLAVPCLSATAQTSRPQTQPCALAKKAAFQNASKAAMASPLENDYDVHYVKLEISANNQNTQISGKATTKATVVAAEMNTYVFELDQQMVIDSALFNGVPVSVTGSGVARTITLPAALPAGVAFQSVIYYHGASEAGWDLFPKGLSNMASPSWQNRVTFTLSEAYSAKDWWPCKQSLTDKIDSCDIWLTVPANLKAGSNGVLEQIVTLPGGKKQFQWKSRHPIDYYLISFAVSDYVDYSYYQQLGGGDSVLIQNYVYNNPNTLPFFKSEIDSVGLMLAHYSQLFGRYPFWQEKYGHCMAPISGGMEHQTMSTVGFFETTLTAHELAHQWWGDYVTCGSWADIWLNEGFAGYSEYLFLAQFHGAAAAAADMQERHNDILSLPGGTVYVTDTLDEDRLFDSRLTYNKGAAVAHMLRYLAQDDNLFFASLRQYLAQYQISTALTGDFKNVLSAAYGMNLDTFFQQWIYGEGYPTFNAQWNQADGMVYVQLDQTTSRPGSVPYFVTPVDIRLKSSSGDTTVRVTIHGSSATYAIPWNRNMTSLSIDPDNWILNKTGNISKNTALSLAANVAARLRIFPNPAREAWQLQQAPPGARLALFNLQGQLLWQHQTDAQGSAIIPAGSLPAGIYMLSLQQPGAPASFHRLTRQ